MIYLLSILILLGSWFLPWWGLALFSGLVGWFCRGYRSALFVGFFGPFVTWFIVIYYFDLKAHGQISERVSGLFGLSWAGTGLVLTALMGGLIGMFSACMGHSSRAVLKL